MATVQKLREQDWENRVNCRQRILANVPPNAIFLIRLTSDEDHFHLTGCVNKQNFRYWAGAKPMNFTRDRFTVRELRFGVL